MLNLVKNKMKW